MIYRSKPGQVSYGEPIGIILLENFVPFIPGDVANASSYNYPVRFQRVPGFSVERIMDHDMTLAADLVDAALALQAEGVQAITGDCGFMALYQEQIKQAVNVPVFMSSLMQIPFIRLIIGNNSKIGIITANSRALNDFVLSKAGVLDSRNLIIEGLENSRYFFNAVFEESGILDSSGVKQEIVDAARKIKDRDHGVEAILLECSLMPPYGAAVRKAAGVPVFDYMTMIDFVYSSVIKREFQGYM